MKKTKKKYHLLQFFSWFFLLAPITGVLVYNAKDYFTMQQGFVFPQSIELGMGITLSAVSGVMLVIGKFNAFKGSKGLMIMLLLSVLLKSILNDVILILTALTVGSLVHSAFQPKINELKEIYKEERQAGIQAKALENVLSAKRENKPLPIQEINGRG